MPTCSSCEGHLACYPAVCAKQGLSPPQGLQSPADTCFGHKAFERPAASWAMDEVRLSTVHYNGLDCALGRLPG